MSAPPQPSAITLARLAWARSRKAEKSVVPGKGKREVPSTRPPAAWTKRVVSASTEWPKA